ncbi:MAG: carboxypeptidase regulatory-like domain-containing protein [Pseudomonadota bacterium]
MRLYKSLLIAAAAFLLAAPAYAQFSTSSIAGVVTDETGAPVANAEVLVVHEPTGTAKTAVTQESGRYRARGLRVGGPYTVTVTKEGFQGDQFGEVYINLSDEYALNAQLQSGSAQLGTLEVVGDIATAGQFGPDMKGTMTTITRDQIENYPTISRSLNDFARLDPRVVVVDKARQELSVAGQNNRYNNLTIDNVPANDEFGLNPSGLPARNQVISIETIEEFQINISPYDVAQSNFNGASINAVTKSGTNEFSGSVYYLFRDDSLIGENENGQDFPTFEEDVYGFTVGGPIIKDKLFFFVGYEGFDRTEPGPGVGLLGSNASTIFELDQSEIERIANIAQSQYGLDVGTFEDPSDLADEDENIIVKFDWNVNDSNRLQLTYTENTGEEVIIPDRNVSEFSLGSYWYTSAIERDATNLIWYSDWTPNLTTEVNFSTSSYLSTPITRSRAPQTLVMTEAGDVLFGTERFRHANRLDTDVTTFYAAGEYIWGDHNIKFGFDYKETDIANTFVFGSLGSYEFDSIEDFEAGIPSDYEYRIGSNPADPFPAADWALENTGFFIQDTWEVSYDFSLTYGIRIDIPSVDDSPLFNQLFTDTFGFRNDATIDGNEIIQPRVGFNWDISQGEYSSQLRGGVGLFAGSSAGVWLSNPFTNPGGNLNVFGLDDTIRYSADPDNQPLPAGGADAAQQDVDVIDPNLEQPTIWRANLAYDRELPWGIQGTAELVHSEVENAIQYRHLNLGAPNATAATPNGLLPDGRNNYWCDPTAASGFRCNADAAFNDVLLLENTSEGSSTNFTLDFSKRFNDNWTVRLGKTWSRSDAVNPGTSSRAISNWNNRATFNPNEEQETTANYEIQSRTVASIEFRDNLFGDLETSVTAFYERRSGRPFSFTFDNDANGDRIFDNDLLFVPAGPGDVEFTDPAEEAEFFALVDATPCLSEFRGTVVTRNHCRSESVGSLDISIRQELPFFDWGGSEIYINILNFGNLINDEWGRIDQVPFEYVAEAVDFEGLTADGRYIYDLRRTEFNRRQDGIGQSRWQVQLGLRVTF